jgi:hypothetical protein
MTQLPAYAGDLFIEGRQIVGDHDVCGQGWQGGTVGWDVMHRMTFRARLPVVPVAGRRWQD